MQDVIADQNYYYDEEGNVTTDESKGSRWLAREGANVLEENREALAAFQSTSKATPKAGAVDEESAKSAKPSANKSAKPAADKGAK